MARIPVIDYESKVQIGDKTRFDGEKCFVTKDITDPMTGIKIALGSASAINVYDADPKKRYLDAVWEDWNWDIDSTLNRVYFTEDGVEKTATIPEDEYTFAELLTEIETQMNSAGDFDYVVGANERNEITISAGGNFGLIIRNRAGALLPTLGFKFDSDSDDSIFKGARVETARRKVVVTVETTASGPVVTGNSKTFYVELFTPESDYLFTSDQDLLAEEADIMKWVPKGRSTHLNVHRRAQQNILDWFDRNGYCDENGEKLDKWAVTDVSQVKLWSAYLALRFIFKSISNAIDDVFASKAEYYEKLEIEARNRAVLKLAFRTNTKEKGKVDADLSPSSWGGTLVRR